MRTLTAYTFGTIPAIGVTLIWFAMDYLLSLTPRDYWTIFLAAFCAAGWANLYSPNGQEARR